MRANRTFIAAMLFLAFCFTAICSVPAEAAAPPGKCEIMSQPPKDGWTDEDTPPAMKQAAQLPCGKFDRLFAYCTLNQKLEDYGADVYLVDAVAEEFGLFGMLNDLKVTAHKDGLQMLVTLAPEGEAGQGLIAQLCEPGEDEEFKDATAAALNVVISAGVKADTIKEEITDPDTGEVTVKEKIKYDYTPVAVGGIAIVRTDPDQPQAPPNWEDVKDELRRYWPARYPDSTFIDGYPMNTPQAEKYSGYSVFSYDLNVILTDTSGNQLTCDLRDARFKVMETGGIIVDYIEFNQMQDCL